MTFTANDFCYLVLRLMNNSVHTVKYFVFLLLAFCAIQSNTVISQETIIEKSTSFKHISRKDGLSQSVVVEIVQDNQGFLWFATQDGLNRYDGYTFTVYSHLEGMATSLDDDHITALYVTKQNELWVGTARGVNVFNPIDETFTHVQLGAGKALFIIKAIYQDNLNNMWVGTTDGLYYQDKGSQLFKRYHDNIFDRNIDKRIFITSILEDIKGRIWVGTQKNGLYRLNKNRSKSINYKSDDIDLNSISDNRIRSVYETSKGELWIGTSNGLNKYDDRLNSFDRYLYNSLGKKSSHSSLIKRVYEDSEGVLWIGTRNGLLKFNREKNTFIAFFHNESNSSSLSKSSISSIYEDKYGLLWVGTHGGGLNIFDRISNQFSGYQGENNDLNKFAKTDVNAIYEDSYGVLWFGKNNALVALDRKKSTYQIYKHDPLIANSLGKGIVYTIYEDKHNQLWVGSFDSGLSKFDRERETFSHYDTGKYILAIYEDDAVERTLWFGSSEKGLSTFNTNTEAFRQYPILGDKKFKFTAILGEGNDHLWLGVYSVGVIHFNKKDGSYIVYEHDPTDKNSLISNSVLALFVDDNEHLWIGTSNGLDQFNPKTEDFIHYNTTDGLPNNVIYSILPDDQGNLWLSTNKGLSRLHIATKKFKNFDVSDGLQSNEFNINSAMKNSKGKLFFGGIKGVNAFFPDQISEHTIGPDVLITDLRLFNKSIPIRSIDQSSPLVNVIEQTNDIILTHLDYVFSFEFSAIHFADPLQNKYAYQLEGFDKNWVYTDATQRRATYTNLPSGEYIFRVKGSNKDGVWSDKPATITVTILQAPWLTWWAYLLYIILIGTILGLIFYRRYKIIVFKRQAAEKIKRSEERLSMALWGSGDQFWDFNIISGVVHRVNDLEGFIRPKQTQVDHISDLETNIHKDDKMYFIEQLTKSIEGKLDVFEITYRLKNVNEQWVWVMNKGRIASRDSDGKALRMAGVLTNIHLLYETQSKLKQLNQDLEDKVMQRTIELQYSIDTLKDTQEQLIQSEKMAALGDLVAGLAHEVNTPLGICVTILSVQLDTLSTLKTSYSTGELTSEHIETYMQKSYDQLDVAERNIERAAKLIKSFKQVAVDQTHEVKTDINFKEYVQIIINSNSPNIKRANVSVLLNIPNDLVINTFPGVWAQIITNFIENSIAHGFIADSSGKKINIDVSITDTFNFIYSDNGKGMSQEQISRVFEPFYTTKRGQGGTGLGMSICYNLVTQKLQGSITCPESYSGGVNFSIVCDLNNNINNLKFG